MSIYSSRYKDVEAVTIESAAIRAQFLPGVGSKLASLVYRPAGMELMVQRPGEQYLCQPYAGSYVAGECSGMDDMLPGIDVSRYETYPWEGTVIPDHGELWALPWQCDVEGDRAHFSTHGVRFPYRIDKWVSLRGEDVLRLDYRLTNQAPFAWDFVWAAHAMINLEEGVEVVLPEGVSKLVAIFSKEDSLGPYGHELDWPIATMPDGQQRDMRLVRSRAAQDMGKYYIKGRMPAGWCALRYQRSRFALTLSWPVEQVPYLSVFPNECGWQDLYNIFVEPCSGSFDRLDVARLHGQYSTLPANGTYEWHLEFAFSKA
jgi:hypothetical protein